MLFYKVEIFDGKPMKDMYLEEDTPLKDQWWHLTEDITGINYLVNGQEFFLDISWCGGVIDIRKGTLPYRSCEDE